jgi:hypothetical protein
MRIGKALTGCVAAMFLLAAPSVARGDHLSEYEYIVLHGDELIGSYRVDIARNGNEIIIEAETDLKVGFGPLTVFEFEHRRRELWRDREFVESIARTTKNGETYDIKITRQAEGYKRVVNGREDQLDDPVRVLALWHDDLLEHEFFISPLEDKLYRLSVHFVGEERIEIGDQRIQARHYRMTGDSERELWYDEAGHILKVRLYDYGSTIDYVLDRGDVRAKLASRTGQNLSTTSRGETR